MWSKPLTSFEIVVMVLGTTPIGLIILAIDLVVVAVNLMVIGVIYKVPKLHKKESAFIVSMAVSDTTQALVSLFQEVPIVNINEGYPMIYMRLLYYLSYTTTMLAICGLSVIKYIRIKYTFRYKTMVTKKTIKISILLLWIVPMFQYITFIFIFLYSDPEAISISITRKVIAVTIIMAVYLPCLIMVYVYCRLYFCARQHLRNQSQLAPGNPQANNPNRAVRTIGAIMGSFLVCWMPKALFELLFSFYNLHDIYYAIFTVLSVIGPGLNALVYCALDNDFKVGFRSMI